MKLKISLPKLKKEREQDESSRGFGSMAKKLSGYFEKVETFTWDFLGVLLISIALISLLALLGFTEGSLITPWAIFLRRWFGIGAYLAIIILGLIGMLSFRKKIIKEPVKWLWRIIIFEGLLFSLMVLISLLQGRSLERAEAGLDGGLIGWGLAEIAHKVFPDFITITILLFLCILMLIIVFGVQRQSRNLYDTFVKWLKSTEFYSSGLSKIINQGSSKPPEKTVDELSIVENDINEPELKDITPDMPINKTRKQGLYPPINLLMNEHSTTTDEENIHSSALMIERTLDEFGIPSRVVGFKVGPTVTQFAVEPGYIERIDNDGKTVRHKIRVSQISALSRDLAMALSADRLRIEAPVPGQSFVGIEVPNPSSSLVRLRPLIESERFKKLKSSLGITLGKDVSGFPVVADLASMPHLLIAGTTGSGKSICIQAMIVCLAMNNSPEELRMAILDPKMVELVRFNGLPHLYGKVETEPERMIGVLKWALIEMDQRYRKLEKVNARDIDSYNRKMKQKDQETLPRIVILVDELADLMMTAPEQTEHSLVRLAQMARATGIHLVVATQRPSTDIVTGLIKANFPARISFSVASSIDSRVILDTTGAETLLGKGDMLYLPPESGKLLRAQGVMVTEHEVERVINFWQRAINDDDKTNPWETLVEDKSSEQDNLVDQAVEIVRKTQRASTSMLQRRLRVGYPRAARLVDELEDMGVVGPAQVGGREREVLLPPIDEEDISEEPQSS